VLLQPERINAYAQAVIRTLQADEHQRGCLMEERVFQGDLAYESSMPRLAGEEERFVLLAMHRTLVERGLCLRQPTDKGNLLVFPSYYRRERPDIVKYPAVLVNYRFTGFLDEIYATLVVRLHHTEPFQQDQLWRYAADFKTNTRKQLGVRLTRRAMGVGELEVYFDLAVAMEEKIIFSKYVHEHLLQHARDVERLRHYVCPQFGTPVGNHEVAMKRLNDWLRGRPPQPEAGSGLKFRKSKEEPPSIICVGCEQRVPLWDEMEQCFASPEIQQRVRDLQEESAIELSNQSKERALVGEVISTVALADQISREFKVSAVQTAKDAKYAKEGRGWNLFSASVPFSRSSRVSRSPSPFPDRVHRRRARGHRQEAPPATQVGRFLPARVQERRGGNLHDQGGAARPLLDGAGVSRAAGGPQRRRRGALDESARLVEARERRRQEAGEAHRLCGRAVRCDGRAAVAG